MNVGDQLGFKSTLRSDIEHLTINRPIDIFFHFPHSSSIRIYKYIYILTKLTPSAKMLQDHSYFILILLAVFRILS